MMSTTHDHAHFTPIALGIKVRIAAIAVVAAVVQVIVAPLPARSDDVPPAAARKVDPSLLTRAELSRFEATSRYDDVVAFGDALSTRSPLIRVATFGVTHQGRKLPLWILADPPVATPEEARGAGKTIVFVMANIHAGEVEGKEAAQHVARRILLGDLRPRLRNLVVLIAPIYNADGNEPISTANRPEQYGPVDGVGLRENAQGLDLNRDYIKLESPEARALVRLFRRWDPHLTVDLHTTNGSYHGYHLTYSTPLHPSADPRILAFHHDQMMPDVAATMIKDYHFRTYYYGNFGGFSHLPDTPARARWEAFTHLPRIGQNYLGFRNRLTILSEAYSYLDFHKRIDVTEAFVASILAFASARDLEIRNLTRAVDLDTTRRGLPGADPLRLDVACTLKPLPKPVEILVGAVEHKPNPRSGKPMTVMIENKLTPTKMLDYGRYESLRQVPLPNAYVFANDPTLRGVLENLQAQGVVVEQLAAPAQLAVESFAIETLKPAGRPFQGHKILKITGKFAKSTIDFPAGSYVVRTAQPLARLAACLLEPESEDGLAAWNFLDAALAPGKVYPIHKLTGVLNASARLVE